MEKLAARANEGIYGGFVPNYKLMLTLLDTYQFLSWLEYGRMVLVERDDKEQSGFSVKHFT